MAFQFAAERNTHRRDFQNERKAALTGSAEKDYINRSHAKTLLQNFRDGFEKIRKPEFLK